MTRTQKRGPAYVRRRGYPVRFLVLLIALLVAGCGSGGEAGPPPEAEDARTVETRAEGTTPGEPVEVRAETLVSGLELPWDVAFLPEGDALLTERDSNRLLRVTPEGEVSEVQTLDVATGNGEGGLLGVALSPEYAEDGYVYAYYTTEEDNRIARFRLGEEPEPVFTGLPSAGIHNGGRIEFGPDGMLYVGTGDAAEPDLAQDRGSPAGKILRLTPEGEVPPDNPVPGNPMYSMGHRNVQGLAWDGDGQLYASEFGQDAYDELNRIEAGENYGWPEVEGEGGEPEYTDPIGVWRPSEASPSGVAILRDGAVPQWEGDLFMTALRGERLWRVSLERGEEVGRESLLEGDYGRLRHVEQAPDGSLWILTSNGTDDRIVRLAPE
ncbi:Glucose/sorbosone dehydrogenase [Rubrobacter radiotolerans]|uniref:Glucose/sorbosone dehydrogenase n=1 Tax=Rubrobacter radiotolerans TaxID=42256 RepID=A0A023X4Z1_RUBRA|nr:PQQ-dependent sugar dehydrogenase [Rubrobacter radiotolerans]AHY47119.1 Glucose/sorbosone dehydrogenase [Rubrobacter radiotolerans]MDX5894524.1 PQQ-dependent sugar dehydrogenase [Rubrobacter radiotolerans]SMC06188.1 Glucose/arabinose dehydrogenase, beta-propeller fold [Rubrobacter radiotolerans DSM 5868]